MGKFFQHLSPSRNTPLFRSFQSLAFEKMSRLEPYDLPSVGDECWCNIVGSHLVVEQDMPGGPGLWPCWAHCLVTSRAPPSQQKAAHARHHRMTRPAPRAEAAHASRVAVRPLATARCVLGRTATGDPVYRMLVTRPHASCSFRLLLFILAVALLLGLLPLPMFSGL